MVAARCSHHGAMERVQGLLHEEDGVPTVRATVPPPPNRPGVPSAAGMARPQGRLLAPQEGRTATEGLGFTCKMQASQAPSTSNRNLCGPQSESPTPCFHSSQWSPECPPDHSLLPRHHLLQEAAYGPAGSGKLLSMPSPAPPCTISPRKCAPRHAQDGAGAPHSQSSPKVKGRTQ